MARLFRNEVQIDSVIPKVLHQIIKPLVRGSVVETTSPSLFMICGKSKANESIPRIQHLLIEAKIIKRNDRVRFVISNNRYENYNSTNIIVYDGNNHPLYFCKIARDPKISGLQTEAENLSWLSNKISTSKGLSIRMPELLYFGVVDDIKILVTTFLDVKNVNLTLHYIMNKGFDKIGITNKFIRKNIGFVEERRFLKRIDKKIRQAISSLVEFQQITSNGKADIKDIYHNIVNKYYDKYQVNLPDEIKKGFAMVEDKIRRLPAIGVLTCPVHGDYDFDNVLFCADGKVGLVDFEHVEKEGFPFFDLALLIFNPLILKWKNSYLRNEPFAKYLNQYGAMEYTTKWLKYFCDLQHLPYSMISIIPLVAAIEQNAKSYPSFRDPNTYPMYGENMLKEFLSLNFDGKS